MNQLITQMINQLNEYNETGAIGYSTYRELIQIVREMQVENKST